MQVTASWTQETIVCANHTANQQSLTLGLAKQSYQAASSVRLINRVADLFEASSGKYGHNLRNQAHFLRAVLAAKLDDNGKPHTQSQQSNDTDWSTFNFNDFIYDTPSRPAQQSHTAWQSTLPADHGITGLDAFLNSGLDFGMGQNIDVSAYWSVIRNLQSLSLF